MSFDLEVVVPVSNKYRDRINYFKKYGLVNIKERKILLNLLVSNERIKDLETGWHPNITVKVVDEGSCDFVQNVFRFFCKINPSNINSRWLAKIDDDSCTDVDGLVQNLDRFYDHEENYYLAASLSRFIHMGIGGPEGGAFYRYANHFDRTTRDILTHEVECCILSQKALKTISSNDLARDFLRVRAGIEGGATDCALSFAAILAKVHPLNCFFITHEPLVAEFSMFRDGIRNHIHCIGLEGENFFEDQRCDSYWLYLLRRVIEGEKTEIENSLANKRFLLENDREILIFEFAEDFVLRVKFEDFPRRWFEKDGVIYALGNGETLKLRIDENGNLFNENMVLKRLI